MTRHWRTLSCVIAVTAASRAWALSVGEPQTLSYLSEPLQVHLPVSDWAGEPEPEKYRLRLLPDQAYAAHGLSAPQNRPSDLTVQWRREGQNEPYVVIRTQRPITEPILTLLLEMRSGKQVAVRQIDLLLDLPAGVQSRKAGSALPTRATRRVVTRPSARIQTRSYGPVRPGESLSRIAQKVRPDPSISLARMAGALMQANPDAFSGDANSLRVNVILRIPSLSEIRAAKALDDLFASAPRRAAANKPNSAAEKRPPAFLPRAIYTRGRLWALTMEFPSYEAIRPVDLTPKLKALEAKEPILFKADWTLGSTGTGAAPRARVAQTSVPPPPEPTVTGPVETPVATTTEQTQEEHTEPAAPPSEQAAAASGMEFAKTTENTPVATPQSTTPAAPQTETGAAPPPAADSASDGTTLWPWLLAVFGVIGAILWWRRGLFTIAVPVRDDEQDAPLHDAPAATPGDQPSLKEQRAIARLRKRLAPWLQMNASEHQRQAQVAQALLERGRLDQAQRLIDELEQEPPAPEPQQKPEAAPQADSPPDNKKSYNPAAELADSQPTELEQRRIRERLKALRRKPLPEASQRQLKVAEAFFDRGDLVQANSILSGLTTSSDD